MGNEFTYLYIEVYLYMYWLLLSVKFTLYHGYLFLKQRVRVLQCSLYDYIQKSKKYAIKNYLNANVTKDQVPFSCRKCVTYPLNCRKSLKMVRKPMKYRYSCRCYKSSEPVCLERKLKRYDRPSSLAHWAWKTCCKKLLTPRCPFNKRS